MKKPFQHHPKKMIHSPKDKPFRVQLDSKTFMMMSRLSSLDVWLKRYPLLKVMST